MATTATTVNGTAKALAAERSAQILNTSANLIRLLRDSTHSEKVAQLPKDLVAKVPNIKSTVDSRVMKYPREEALLLVREATFIGLFNSVCSLRQLLEKMPAVIISLDTHMDEALKSASHLGQVNSLLAANEEYKTRKDFGSGPQQESSTI